MGKKTKTNPRGAGAPLGNSNRTGKTKKLIRKPLPFRIREDLIEKAQSMGGRDWLESLIESSV